jgi:hypothetical protein
MADNAVVADVLASYQDRDNRPPDPPSGPDRAEFVAAVCT